MYRSMVYLAPTKRGVSGLGDGEMDELASILGGGTGSGGVKGAIGGSGAGSNWSGFFQDLAKQWTQIGGKILAPTYQADASGNITYRQPGGSTSTGIAPGGFASISTGTMLLVGGGLLVTVLVIKSASGGRR